MTPKEAQTKECRAVPPMVDEDTGIAKFHKCSADKCALWRWQPLMADDAYMAAVKKCVAGGMSNADASKHVKDNRGKFGLPTSPFRGWCGLSRRPEGM